MLVVTPGTVCTKELRRLAAGVLLVEVAVEVVKEELTDFDPLGRPNRSLRVRALRLLVDRRDGEEAADPPGLGERLLKREASVALTLSAKPGGRE